MGEICSYLALGKHSKHVSCPLSDSLPASGSRCPRKIWERGGRDLRVALWRRVHCVLGWATPAVLISPLLGGTCVFQLSLEMRTCHLSE